MNYSKKRRSRSLRKIIRGHRYLKAHYRLTRIDRATEAIANLALPIRESEFSEAVMGKQSYSRELSLRQYLITRLIGYKLNSAISLAAAGHSTALTFPLPNAWRKEFNKQGFEFNEVVTTLTWSAYTVLCFLRGVSKIFRNLIYGLFSDKMIKSGERHVAFNTLTVDSLPNTNTNDSGKNIVTWYLQWSGKADNVSVVIHDIARREHVRDDGVRVLGLTRLIMPLSSWLQRLTYLTWGISVILIAFIDMMRGRWWTSIMLAEAADRYNMELLSSDDIAAEYMFNNSSAQYRPIWTYEAEAKGAAITFYFYSTNAEKIHYQADPATISYQWIGLSWPRYLVWDSYQAEFVHRCSFVPAEIKIVGPIWFRDGLTFEYAFTDPFIAVFDVSPLRSSRYSLYLIESDYYVPQVVESFLEDVSIAIADCGLKMVWKRKKETTNYTHPHYLNRIKHLETQPQVVSADYRASPDDIILKSKAVISLPFTSTASIAKHLGKPSIYYDPTGKLDPLDPAAHGVPVLSSKEDLAFWLSSISCSSIINTGHS